MAETKKYTTRHDIIGSVMVDAATGTAVGRPYLRCPHCGLVDYRRSAQGIKQSHFPIWGVGAESKYECGKCRKQFHTIQVCVPTNVDPLTFYEKINSILVADASTPATQSEEGK